MRGDLAPETEGPHLIAALTAPTSEHHGAVGAGAGIIDLIPEQIGLAELLDGERAPSTRPDHAYTCPRAAIAIGV